MKRIFLERFSVSMKHFLALTCCFYAFPYPFNDSVKRGKALISLAVIFWALWTTISAAQSDELQVTRFSGPDETHHSYFINGLASAIPDVGYGLRNLSSDLHGKHYAYFTPVESTGPIQVMVLSDIRKRIKNNPSAKINLIGISYGGNIATLIAQQLNLYNIPVNYLAVLDAPAPVPITGNVHRVDNFYCRRIGCIGQPIQLAWGNSDTIKEEIRVKSGHIQLGAMDIVKTRITGQLSEAVLDPTLSGE